MTAVFCFCQRKARLYRRGLALPPFYRDNIYYYLFSFFARASPLPSLYRDIVCVNYISFLRGFHPRASIQRYNLLILYFFPCKGAAPATPLNFKLTYRLTWAKV